MSDGRDNIKDWLLVFFTEEEEGERKKLKLKLKLQFLLDQSNLCTQRPPGVNFTKLICQAKSCRQTAFGEKFEVQFHQQSSKAKIWTKFAKLCTPFAKCHSPEKVSNLVRAKNSCANVDEIDPRSVYTL
jgi:hypothetical protein